MTKRTSSSRSRKPTRRVSGRRTQTKKRAKRPRGTTTKRTATRRGRALRTTRKRARTVRPKPSAHARPSTHAVRPPTLARERRQLPDAERGGGATGDTRTDARLIAEAKAGHDAVAKSISRHTESSPELTAGDLDARWDDSVGDESPGGDNPTPGQNEVDAIGRALGTEYDDDEELMGGDEIGARDAHRWELDPHSRDKDEE